MRTDFDLIVVGKGPAGISAAIYALRANLSVLVVAKDSGALGKAHAIANYYGFEEPISGKDLELRGEVQAENLGAIFVDGEVLDLFYEDKFQLRVRRLDSEERGFSAKAVVVATGSVRSKVPVNGLSEFEGKGVSYCAVCDGFFCRNKNVAVLGNGAYALSEAKELLPLASKVFVCTLGAEPAVNFSAEFSIEKEMPVAVEGLGRVQKIRFESGKELLVDGIFVAAGSAGAADLARKAGAALESGKLVVDRNMMTTVPGLFAAGDCLGGILQVAVAVGEGAKAGISAVEYIRKIAAEGNP